MRPLAPSKHVLITPQLVLPPHQFMCQGLLRHAVVFKRFTPRGVPKFLGCSLAQPCQFWSKIVLAAHSAYPSCLPKFKLLAAQFACRVDSNVLFHMSSFIKIGSVVLPLWVVENCPFPLLWPLAYTTGRD